MIAVNRIACRVRTLWYAADRLTMARIGIAASRVVIATSLERLARNRLTGRRQPLQRATGSEARSTIGEFLATAVRKTAGGSGANLYTAVTAEPERGATVVITPAGSLIPALGPVVATCFERDTGCRFTIYPGRLGNA